MTDPIPFERPTDEQASSNGHAAVATAEPVIGPTGRPMPDLPEPGPVTRPGNARVISMYANLLPPGPAYSVRVRAVLDMGGTPAALKWLLFWTEDWSAASRWYTWTLRP